MRSRNPRRNLIASLLLVAVAAVATVAALGSARADVAAEKPKSDSDWQPVQTQMVQPGESFEAKNLVAASYGFIWVMVAGFVFTVWRRTDRLESEIESLRAQLKQKGGGR